MGGGFFRGSQWSFKSHKTNEMTLPRVKTMGSEQHFDSDKRRLPPTLFPVVPPNLVLSKEESDRPPVFDLGSKIVSARGRLSVS